MLVEAFLPGREFTLGMLGERRPRVLAPLEVVFTDAGDKHPVYGFESKFYSRGIDLQVPAKVDPALGKELQRVARAAFIALGCRDVARVDVRLDAEGRVHFIECNPLPGLTPGFSDLCLIANACGMDYRTLIGEILASALRRMRERRQKRPLDA
jgi:D-alanine-D-alanine ligase